MARISLRAYNRDIEAMIDKNQIDEAFAHCRYILELYPKHIDTYRLMGKALLEAQRFSDASDVFHRVLSSVPDDFISHLGMSIIREDESNLDAAIWHMERSFEVQPSNAAVQVELRRLYGLRDGVTPQKIQLTRGALARMSAKSNLHSQAIAELRAALSNDPQRPDLLVVLAEMYLQTGSRMESIETCNALINKLPYCMAANRILAEVLPETERADKAHEYKSRLGELDPYYLQLSPVAPTLEQVPDGAVTIERFEYTGESFEAAEESQPAWAASLGVDLDDEQMETDEPAPDWLEESGTDAEATSGLVQDETSISDEKTIDPEEDQLLSSEEEGTSEDEEIPDWMGEIGEDETTAASVLDLDAEPPAEQEAEMEESQFAAGEIEGLQESQEDEEIPDWMAEIDESDEQDSSAPIPGITAGAGAGAAVVGAVVSGQEDDQSEPEPDAELEEDEVIQVEEAAGEPIPDWMAEAGADEEPAKREDLEGESLIFEGDTQVEDEDGTAESSPEEEAETPDWMSESETADESETPDWLRDAMEGSDEDEDAPLPEAAALAAGAEILTDEDEPALMPEAEPQDDELDETPGEDAELDLTAEEGFAIGEAALVGAAVAGAALGASLDDEDEQSTESADDAEFPADDELTAMSSDGEEISELEQDVPDWLQELGEDMPTDEQPTEPPLVFEDQPPAEEAIQEPGLEIPADDAEPEAVPETQPSEDGEPITVAPGADPDEDLLEAEFPDSIPDWLSEVSPDEIPAEVAEAEAELDIVRAEIPVWLRKMEAQHKAELEAAGEVDRIEDLELEAEFTDLSGEDVPSWLMSAMETELPSEVDEITEVEDISEVFETEEPVGIDQIGLESSSAGETEAEPEDEIEDVDEDLDFEQLQEELAPGIAEPEALIEPDDAVEEVDEYTEQLGDLTEPDLGVEPELVSQELAEETESIEESEAEVTDEEHDGIGVPGLVAAGAAAAHLLDEDDTQPVVVSDGTEITSDLDAEHIEEEPVVEDQAETLEVEDDIASTMEEEETEVPAISADDPLSGEDQDAAMAWLESLAAKQGAAEEELLTPADERLEEPPGWVQDEIESPQEDDDEVEERDTALTAAALAGVTAGILAGDEEAVEEAEDKEVVEEAEVAEPVSEEVPDEPSEWVPEVLAEEEQPQDDEDEVAGEEIDIEPGPLEIEEEPDVVEELAAAAEVDLDQVETVEAPEEIPDWLSGLAVEQEAAVEPDTAEWTPDMLAEEVEESAPAVESPIGEKLDLNVASLAQLEKIPGIGFIFAQNIVNHRAAAGSFTDLEQLGDVEGLTPEIVADLEDYLTVEVVKEVSATESEIPELQDAWDNISEGNIEGAVDQYTNLITQHQYLDEVIRDIQSALGKYPSNSSLYQSLGDAYMRVDMLQEALDAYNRAEDLIN